jgi:hypothetical protein
MLDVHRRRMFVETGPNASARACLTRVFICPPFTQPAFLGERLGWTEHMAQEFHCLRRRLFPCT